MGTPGRKNGSLPRDLFFGGKPAKAVPHKFVLDSLAPIAPWTRPMFGCLAVYVDEKIVLILRDKLSGTTDNGIWLAAVRENHESLRREFPNMRSIEALGQKITGWQLLPADAPDFEESALHACELITAQDPRIGKVPVARRKSKQGSRNQTPKATKDSRKR